jgi:hypothetical protein
VVQTLTADVLKSSEAPTLRLVVEMGLGQLRLKITDCYFP